MLLFIFSLDYINIGIWEKLDTIRDDELRHKAANLPELFRAAFAGGTIEKYRRAWQKWVQWTTTYSEVSHCPADPFFVCIYFNDLIKDNTPISAIISAFCGIRWGHINAGYESPTDCQFVKLAFEGAKRLACKSTVRRKEPFTADMIRHLVSLYDDSENLLHLRFLIICIFGFAGFFRISELLDIQLKHISLEKDSIEIFLEKSKTDQHRDGETVYIAQSGNSTCPLYWIKRYLRLAKLDIKKTPEYFLICKMAKTKSGHNAHGKHPITYPTARKTFLEHVNEIFKPQSNQYGLHSLRSGGATAASENGVCDRLIGKRGRWSANSSVKDIYIKDSKKKRLSVSQKLGL